MKTFVYKETASGERSFTKVGDAWDMDRNLGIFAVADSPIRYLVIDTKEYPFDDHGYDAASTFCASFVKYSKKEINKPNFSEETLKKILKKCNEDIKKLNIKLGKKYNNPTNYDLAETVGMGALIKNDTLYYGGLEDCYVNILRGEKLEDVSKWQYQILKASKYLDYVSEKGELGKYIPKELKGKLKKEHEWEPCWCNYLRNNPEALDDKGNLVGWGCFTGEKETEEFIQTYSVSLKKGDHILLFSDGMIPVLENDEFVKWYIQNVNSSFYFQHEMRVKIMELLKGSDAMYKEKTLIYTKF
jgi:hypothetical protein